MSTQPTSARRNPDMPAQPPEPMSHEEANQKRLIAHEIIRQLHEARETGQIQLLMMACHLSLQGLAPEDLKKTAKNLLTILP